MFNYDDVMLGLSSLFWTSGVLVLLLGTLYGSTRIITTDVFSPELQLRLIEKHKVTSSFNAPRHIMLMMESDHFKQTDISSLRFLFVGGDKFPLHLRTEFSRRLQNGTIIPCYGSSEIAGALSFGYPAMEGKETVGRLLGGICVKIVNDNGNRCGVNVDGEICVKMKYNFLGYFGNPQATMEMFDEDGFFLTGDIGHFDEDGDLFVTGRKKEMMKYGGFHIFPSEIDAFLTKSSDISAACVVGIPDRMGDLPAAVVVRAQGSTISEQNVFDMVEGNIESREII